MVEGDGIILNGVSFQSKHVLEADRPRRNPACIKLQVRSPASAEGIFASKRSLATYNDLGLPLPPTKFEEALIILQLHSNLARTFCGGVRPHSLRSFVI